MFRGVIESRELSNWVFELSSLYFNRAEARTEFVKKNFEMESNSSSICKRWIELRLEFVRLESQLEFEFKIDNTSITIHQYL